MNRRIAFFFVLGGGLGHAALSWWLHGLGHEPAQTWLPAGTHYLLQAVFVVPLYLSQWFVLSSVVRWLLRVPVDQVATDCGMVLGVCTLFMLVLPDAILLGVGGTPLLRHAAPAILGGLFVGSWVTLTALLYRGGHATTAPRAAVVSFLGLLAQASMGSLLLR